MAQALCVTHPAFKQNTLKEGLVQERSSNAVKPVNSFIEVTGPIAVCSEHTP